MLKITITLCLLAVSSGLKVTEIIDTRLITVKLEIEIFHIQQTVSNMHRKINAVGMDNFELYLKTIMEINYMQLIAESYILNKMAAELNKTRADIDDAEAQGKDAEYCFEAGERDQQKIKASMNEELHKCAKHSIQLFVNSFSFPTDLREYAERATKKLADVVLLCMSQMSGQQKCLDSEVQKTNVYVENFNRRYGKGRKSRQKAYENAESNALLCIGETIKNTKKKIDEWVFFTDSCVEGAE